METLVDDLLQFTRIVEPLGVRLHRYSTDQHTVFREIGSDMSVVLHRSGARIHVETTLPFVNMLPVHLRQTLRISRQTQSSAAPQPGRPNAMASNWRSAGTSVEDYGGWI